MFIIKLSVSDTWFKHMYLVSYCISVHHEYVLESAPDSIGVHPHCPFREGKQLGCPPRKNIHVIVGNSLSFCPCLSSLYPCSQSSSLLTLSSSPPIPRSSFHLPLVPSTCDQPLQPWVFKLYICFFAHRFFPGVSTTGGVVSSSTLIPLFYAATFFTGGAWWELFQGNLIWTILKKSYGRSFDSTGYSNPALEASCSYCSCVSIRIAGWIEGLSPNTTSVPLKGWHCYLFPSLAVLVLNFSEVFLSFFALSLHWSKDFWYPTSFI